MRAAKEIAGRPILPRHDRRFPATGVVRLDADQRPEDPIGGQYQAGTLRMGASPDDGVTDRGAACSATPSC
jgi:hypothetical protein